MDGIERFKANQKAAWANFATLENLTGRVAPSLVRFARIRPGLKVLDVACGTGVVAVTGARLGAEVSGLDLTPELVARARENAALMRLEASFQEGDVEALPFADATFDVVVSQFGHIFAPRPDVAIAQMLRVLKPGGTIAFATWPPELFMGRSFALMSRFAPPPPAGVSPPQQWGDPNIVRERLGSAVRDLAFTRDTMFFPILSVPHYRRLMEENFGPVKRLLAQLDSTEPTKAAQLRREIEALVAEYFDDNQLRQDFLLTRAIKVGA
ncbi:MAG TPA: class I SAM-dependent methyltransferase [Candidatus Methylomirabilis sp.]|nr:class I SAM-dependent methyltransferase [Candidatus Methylomirabilis sp.]